MLWLAGNRRSDTLLKGGIRCPIWLWLAGNRRSDTLGRFDGGREPCCGWQGIVARIHLGPRPGAEVGAVVGRESSLGYTPAPMPPMMQVAVVGRESSLGYTRRRLDNPDHPAVVGRESSLGYTEYWPALPRLRRCGWQGIVARIHFLDLGFVHRTRCGLQGIVARIHFRRAG